MRFERLGYGNGTEDFSSHGSISDCGKTGCGSKKNQRDLAIVIVDVMRRLGQHGAAMWEGNR